MKIIFVKHGESSFITDKLTLKGKIQIRAVKRYLKDENIDAFFCAPQTRTLQSANLLNKGLNKPLYIIKQFDERKPLLTNQKDLIEEFKTNYMNYNFENTKFETCKEYLDRVFVGFEEILKQESSDINTIVIVGHSSTLYAINAYLQGIPKDKQIKWLQINSGAVIKFLARIKH